MAIASRLTVLATVAVAGLGLTAAIPAAAIPAAASLTPHTRTAATAPRPALSARPDRTPGASQATPLWVSRLSAGRGMAGQAMAVSPNGATVFVTGQQDPRRNVFQGETVALNAATGATVWESEYTAAASSEFFSIAVSPDGSTVFVGGVAGLAPSDSQGVTVAYNATTGAILWTQEPVTDGGPGRVTVSPDGSTVFATGSDQCGSPATSCAVTAAYNAATGAVLWTRQVAHGDPSAIAVSPDGSAVFVTGQLLAPKTIDESTAAYNAVTGAVLWTARYHAPGTASGASIAVSPSGSAVFVTGTSGLTSTTSSYHTIAYSAASGTPLWQQSFARAKYGHASSLAVSPDGSTVFVTGSVGPLSSTVIFGDYGTVAYNATTGARLWTAIYRRPGNGGGPAGIVASPDGSKVFVAGDWSLLASLDQVQYQTVAYDSGTGAQAWAAHYGKVSKGASSAFAVAVSPDGSTVFVTGGSLNYLTTLAYRS
jgi:DNA-binding beta-propeller fold protein YncE